MIVEDLQTLAYRDAWTLQESRHADVVAGGAERLLLVEHPPVITLGRRPGQMKHVTAAVGLLQQAGVDLVESDRGGDVTYHGPGQLVVYPIIRLNDHKLSVGGYVRLLEQVVIDTLSDLGVPAQKDQCAVGVWTIDAGKLAKICAIGVRIRRGVTMHGLALNVTTNLNHFNLIIPCGLAGRAVTSLQRLLRERTPPMQHVKAALTRRMLGAFT